MRLFGCTDSFTWSLRLSEVKMKTAVEEMSYWRSTLPEAKKKKIRNCSGSDASQSQQPPIPPPLPTHTHTHTHTHTSVWAVCVKGFIFTVPFCFSSLLLFCTDLSPGPMEGISYMSLVSSTSDVIMTHYVYDTL